MSGEAALRTALNEHGGALAEAAERSGEQPPVPERSGLRPSTSCCWR